MSFFQTAYPYPSSVGPGPDPQSGRITAGHNVFTDDAGQTWSYRGSTQFLLFYRWLIGENIDAVVDWNRALGVNTVRVLGMVNWADASFSPTLNANWWPELVPFVDYLAARGLRIEFTVFASAQSLMPHASDQRAHLQRVVDTIGPKWNVFIEVANEPWQNGCDPPAIFSASTPRPCPMAYGTYDFVVTHESSGLWVATLPVLDYVTVHTPRDPDSWSRKAKDLSEYRDGSGDGASEVSPLYAGSHKAPVGDEPMGAAEASEIHGRQRSDVPQDFFWYVANAAINGAGSTFHCDAGLRSYVPPPGGDQQKCAEASALAWSNVEPDFQKGTYTRGGLADCPLVFDPAMFPDQTSRIYARLLGNRAIAVAIKPNQGWTPQARNGWHIDSVIGPQDSLVHLSR